MEEESQSWELEDAIKLNSVIEEIIFSCENDQLIWIMTSKTYGTGDGRKFLCSGTQLADQHWKCIWKLKIPPKVQIFM